MLGRNVAVLDYFSDPHIALTIARIECHYFINGCFIRPNQILDEMSAIQHLPGIIVHGRYDAICPIDQALELNRLWPQSQLKIIPDAGHAASEPGISNALVESCNAMLDLIENRGE